MTATVHYQSQLPDPSHCAFFDNYNCSSSYDYPAWTPVKNTDHQSQASTSSQEYSLQFFEQANSPNTKLKTTLCRNYIRDGYCPYNDKCQFAHGVEELKCNNQQKSQYKTKTCPNFTKKGFCPYGSRCNYRHQKPKAKKGKNWKQMYKNFGTLLRQVKMEAQMRDKEQSRLFKILNDNKQLSVTDKSSDKILSSRNKNQDKISLINYQQQQYENNQNFEQEHIFYNNYFNHINHMSQSQFSNYSAIDYYGNNIADPQYFNSCRTF